MVEPKHSRFSTFRNVNPDVFFGDTEIDAALPHANFERLDLISKGSRVYFRIQIYEINVLESMGVGNILKFRANNQIIMLSKWTATAIILLFLALNFAIWLVFDDIQKDKL